MIRTLTKHNEFVFILFIIALGVGLFWSISQSVIQTNVLMNTHPEYFERKTK